MSIFDFNRENIFGENSEENSEEKSRKNNTQNTNAINNNKNSEDKKYDKFILDEVKKLSKWSVNHVNEAHKQQASLLSRMSTIMTDFSSIAEVEKTFVNRFSEMLLGEDDPIEIKLLILINAITNNIPSFEAHVMKFIKNNNSEIDNHLIEAIILYLGFFKTYNLEGRKFINKQLESSLTPLREAAEWAIKRLPSLEVAEDNLVKDFIDFISNKTAQDFENFNYYN